MSRNIDKGYLRMMLNNNINKSIELTKCNYDYTEIENNLNKIVTSYTEKKNINLIISYYKSKHAERNKEIHLAIKLNLQNKLFNKIIIIDETCEFSYEGENSHVIIIKDNRRLHFNDFFKYANQYTENDTINILCNSDIVIGDNFDKINLEDKEMLFLTRYEMLVDGKNELNSDFGSFDTWIWKGKIIESVGNFKMGIGCCDVVLASDMYKNKYLLKNPSLDLKTYHIHCSNIRFWITESSVIGGEHAMKIKHSKLDEIYNKDDYIFLF
jgi:hypothetical protein